MNDDFSDEQLIAHYLKGNKESLEVLIKRYLKPIYSFVYRYVNNTQEAEDITQDVFVKVWRNLKKFDQQRKFKTWIFAIAKNTSIDWLKKKKVILLAEFETEANENRLTKIFTSPLLPPNEFIEHAEVKQLLALAMKKLLPKYRMVLFLRYNDHFTFREIAQSLEEPINTVKTRHRRALQKLKIFLVKMNLNSHLSRISL